MNRIPYFLLALSLFTSCLEEPESVNIDLSKYPKTISGLQNDIWYLQANNLIHLNTSNYNKEVYEIPSQEFPQHARWSSSGNIFGYIDWNGAGFTGAPVTLYDLRNESTVFTSQREFVDFRLNANGELILGDDDATTWYLFNRENSEVNFETFVNETFRELNTGELNFNNGIFKIEWISENLVKATVTGTQQHPDFIILQILADVFVNTSNFPELTVTEIVIHDLGFVSNQTGTQSFRIRNASSGNILEVRNSESEEINIVDTGRINDAYFVGDNYLVYSKLNLSTLGDLVLNYYSVNLAEERTKTLLPELYHRGSISHSPDGQFVTMMGLAGPQSNWQIFITSIAGSDSAYVSSDKYINSNPHFGPRL